MAQVSYKLSPNEETAVLRSQREERRKARLIQVREQEKEAARRTREEEKRKRERERKLLQEHLQSHLLASHAAELAAVEDRYSSATRHFGLGHRQAQQVEKEENRLHELRLLLAAKQRERAEDRHIAALREEQSYKHRKNGEKKRQVERLKLTREQEGRWARENATRTASQPPIIMDLVAGKGRRVRLREVEGYSSSYYHIPSCTVQRTAVEEKEGPDAQQMALLMSKEMQAVDKQCSALKEEQRELARLRHIHALNKVKMEKEKREMLQQLNALEREDRTLRQKALATMPANVYQPVERRKEVVKEQQRDMEQAFERLFVDTHGVSTYPTLHNAGNPTPDPITPSPQPSHPPSTPTTSSQEATPTNFPNSGAPLLERSTVLADADRKVRKSVRVSIPTAKATESDCSYTNSTEVTPSIGSFSASIGSSISTAEETTSGIHNQAQTDGIMQGVITHKRGGDYAKLSAGALEQETAHCVSDSSPDSVSSTPQQEQQRQQQLHELSVSELTPSEVQCPTEHTQCVPQTTTALPIKRSGMTRLVSMVHAQQQAWSQRVAARPTLTEQPTTAPLQQFEQDAELSEKGVDACAEIPTVPGSESHSLTMSTMEQPPYFDRKTREAWLKPSNPITPPIHRTNDLLTTTATNVPHPLSHTARQPSSQLVPPPTTSLTGPSIHESTEPLSITAYNSTFHASSALANKIFQQCQQDSALRKPMPALLISHPSDDPVQEVSSSDSEGCGESGKEDENNDARKGLTLSGSTAGRPGDLSNHAAATHSGHGSNPPSIYSSSPPLVTKTWPSDSLHSSQSPGQPEDDVTASLFPDTLTNLPSSSVAAPPSSTVYPLLLQTPVSLPPDLSAQSYAPPIPTSFQPSSFMSSHPHQFSVSHLSNSLLTPSTVSGFTVTPVSTLPDPSPIVRTVEHTPLCEQDSTLSKDENTRTSQTVVAVDGSQSTKSENAPSDISTDVFFTPRVGGYDSRRRGDAPASLARPNLSVATEDTDRPGHHNSQDTTPCPDVSSDVVQSLDTTPTHATLHLPGDMSESDPSISTAATDTSNIHLPKPANPAAVDLYVRPNSPSEQASQSETHIPSPSLTTPGSVSNSLQEAFLRRKMSFIEQSQKRLEQMKSNASERRIQISLESDSSEQRRGAVYGGQLKKAKKPFDKTRTQKPITPTKQQPSPLSSFPSSGVSHPPPETGKENRKRAVTFSSPVLCSSHSSDLFSPPLEHKAPLLMSTKMEKIGAKEMRLINQRFYNRLPEVRHRKLEEKRRATYALNRQKAKVYQEKVRAKMQKKPVQIYKITRKPFK